MGIPEDKLKTILSHLLRQSSREPDLDCQLPVLLSAATGNELGQNRAASGAMFCFTLSLIETEAAQAALSA